MHISYIYDSIIKQQGINLKEQGGIYGRTWRKERERCNRTIISKRKEKGKMDPHHRKGIKQIGKWGAVMDPSTFTH